MPTFSGEMELRWSGLNSHGQRRYERNFELLKQKTEYLYDMRDSVRDEQIKELMLGTIPSKESHKWLKKERDLQPRLNHLLIFHRERHEDLITTLDEVSHHLENFPFSTIGAKTYGVFEKAKKTKAETKGQSDFIVNARDKEAARSAKFVASLDEVNPVLGHETGMGHDDVGFKPVQDGFTRIFDDDSVAQSQDRATGRKTKNVKHEIKADTRDESAVEVVAQGKKATQRLKGKLAVEKDGRFEAQKSDVMAVKHRGSSLGDIEYQSEIVPAAVTKSVLDADQVPASSIETVIEDEKMRPQQSYTSPLDEYEIQRIHEREGELNVPVKGSVGENRRMLPIHETVPSQPEVESQMNVNQSVGPVETFKAGPSNTTAVEPAPASPFRKKDEIPPVIELSSITEGDVKTSTGRTVLKILGYMNDVTAGKVGVHGIGGIGKTSVLEALINHNETKSLFDSIMFVSVSRYWSIRKIQNEVLRQLSLSREDSETDTQVAEKLFQVLSGRKFLLLLDDVWEQIHLEAVGIPDPCSVKGSKIIMASKKLNVFCDMDVSRVIEVETMSREEAWELFSKQVGRIINSPDIQPFAQAIANGCGGLPLLIIVTGKALTGEDNVTVWEHASRKFSLPGTTGTYQTEDVIQLLKFSFDRLRDYDMKSCFLHCSLFSKDREVTIFELIEYCIQEGVIDGSGGDVHKRGLDIVNDLKRASLLQDTKDDNSIKMHDLIRDLALGILSSVAEGSQYLLRTGSLKEPSNPASSLPPPENSRLNIPEGHQFLLRAGAGLTEPPSEEEWRQAKMIFLMDNDLCTLPERPSCPELLILFLQRNYRLRMIPPSFFDSMTSLKVLNLSKTRVKSLPETLFKLEDLQVLILRDCERLVKLPSEVCHLKHLEVLDLQGTEINKLPVEIGELTSLRHLKVSFYGSIDYSDSMIDFVSKLEELVVEDCPAIEEIVLEGDIIGSDCILLPSLKKLTLHDLPELVDIWKSAWPELEHISFYNCPKLKKIGWNSELKRTIREIEAEKSWWDELEWEVTDLKLELQDHLATI
ncbi:hypothetical protein Q3G72_027839 [Acer saccharum]|nr:hypothetical protein Q3G72_027839 [Acer saccharum]